MKKLLYILLFFPGLLIAQDTLDVDVARLTFDGMTLTFGEFDRLSFQTTSITAGVDTPETSDTFDVYFAESFDVQWDLMEDITMGDCDDIWGDTYRTTTTDSCGLGAYGHYWCDIVNAPECDSATKTGRTTHVWKTTIPSGVCINPWNSGHTVRIPLPSNTSRDVWFSLDMAWMPGYQWDDADLGYNDQGKFPGISSDMDRCYKDNSTSEPWVRDTCYDVSMAWQVEDIGASGWAEDTVSWKPYAWYFDRYMPIGYGETTPHMLKPWDQDARWNWYEINNPTIPDTVWTAFDMHIVSNTFTEGVANDDGYIDFYINGKFSVRKSDMILYYYENTRPMWIRFSYFHNGNCEDYFPSDQWTLWDNLRVWNYKDEFTRPDTLEVIRPDANYYDNLLNGE